MYLLDDMEVFNPFFDPAKEGYHLGFARSRGSAPAAAIETLYGQLDRVEELFGNGSYVELDNGYLIQSDSLLPEAPKLYIFEDDRGLHLQGRGDGLSEEPWLDVTFTGAHYFSRNKSYKVTEGRGMDSRILAIYKGEEDLLHVRVSADMRLPPIDLKVERI